MPQRMYETCTVPGCDRKHKAAGYCASHYGQWKRGIAPSKPIKSRDRKHEPTCSEPECASPVKAKGLCKMHYARLLRHGFTRNRDRKKPFAECSVDECEGRSYTKGMCNQHYLRSRTAAEFGLSLAELVTMAAEQDGKCAICLTPPRKRHSRSDKTQDFCIDHDHETGKPRGLLCDSCNRAIGLLGDSPERLRAAAAYLERHRST